MQKPEIKLNFLEKEVIHTPTQESYDELMRILECGGFLWNSNHLPTKWNYFRTYAEKTCIYLEKSLNGHSNGKFKIGEKNKDAILNESFYETQPEVLKKRKEINTYFKTLKEKS